MQLGQKIKKPVFWFSATVLTAAIGAVVAFVVTDQANKAETANSEHNPIDAHVAPITDRPINGFDLLVANRAELPASVSAISDCSELWSVGIQAGGVPLGEVPVTGNLHNTAKDNIVVTDLRAVVTKHEPARDGFLLTCPKGRGGVDPIILHFDLVSTDKSEAQREDPSGGFVSQFSAGFENHPQAGRIGPFGGKCLGSQRCSLLAYRGGCARRR